MKFDINITYVKAGIAIQQEKQEKPKQQHRNQNFPSFSSFLNLFLHCTIYTELENGIHAGPLPFTYLKNGVFLTLRDL
jgi:hypothetical protein